MIVSMIFIIYQSLESNKSLKLLMLNYFLICKFDHENSNIKNFEMILMILMIEMIEISDINALITKTL